MTPKERLIKRLNKQFDWDIPLNIRIVSHQRQFSDAGGYSWYFSSYDKNLWKWSSYGSTLTITELLKYKTYELYPDYSMIDITPKDW